MTPSFFFPSIEEEVQNLRVLLLMFEDISGIRVNLPKSKMMAVGDVPNLSGLVDLMGCVVSSCPGTYLGLPLGEERNQSTYGTR